MTGSVRDSPASYPGLAPIDELIIHGHRIDWINLVAAVAGASRPVPGSLG